MNISGKKSLKIVIIGPESTGKTTLCESLANNYKTIWIPEFAREYVEKLNRPYTYNDVELIAEKQVEIERLTEKTKPPIWFVDTDLIITKIWFDIVYRQCPDWIPAYIKNNKVDLYLLCNTDLPWIPDSVRENGGEQREILFNIYKSEIEKYGFNYKIISGTNETRIENAIKFIDNEINN